jgi:surfeit locus 1 family protein
MLLTAGTCAALGAWQLARAEEKQALLEAYALQSAAPPGRLPAPGSDPAAQRFQPVRVTGRYDGAHQLLLDARIRDGRAGYEVLTPLVTEGRTVLVNRGWIEADPDRQRLPALLVDDGERTVSGLLDRLPRPALPPAPAPADPAAAWPRRLLYPQPAEIAAALGRPVEPYQLLLAADAADGFRRDWRPQLLPARQHLGYAVQWFALGGVVVVIYVALNIRRAR